MSAELDAHRRRLAAEGRCPACAELVGADAAFQRVPCPRCGAHDPALAARAHELVAEIVVAGRRELLVVAGVLALVHLLLGFVVFIETLTLTAAALWLRWRVVLPATRPLSPRRRLVAIWTARLTVALAVAGTLVLTQLGTLLGPLAPLIKAVLGGGQVLLSTVIVTAYLHRQLRREAAGVPVPLGAWVLLGLLVAGLLAALTVVGLVVALTLGALSWVLSWTGGAG